MADLAAFVEHRSLLFGIAYRLLGSAGEAEDVVQDTYLRWQRLEDDDVESPRALLSTIATRLALDHLRSARVRREQYVGPWLPEPIATGEEVGADLELADSLSTAFLVVLEALSPGERAAFVLRDVFDYPYAEVSAILGRSEAACRQLVHRARAAVAARRPRFPAPPEQRQRLTERFLHACGTGDIDDLLQLLAEDVTLISDGGDKARAARRPVVGRDKVARFLLGVLRDAPPRMTAQVRSVNGGPGIVLDVGDTPFAVVTLDATAAGISQVHVLVNPDKLGGVTEAVSARRAQDAAPVADS